MAWEDWTADEATQTHMRKHSGQAGGGMGTVGDGECSMTLRLEGKITYRSSRTHSHWYGDGWTTCQCFKTEMGGMWIFCQFLKNDTELTLLAIY